MIFNKHPKYEGTHAPFGASQSSWLRYDDNKALETLDNLQAKFRGTELHEWAAKTIKLGRKQPESKDTLCSYINDAIGFIMEPEVLLFYSELFYGTADTISFRDNVLRIHDLKTGVTKVKIEQLYIYTALFCLEYKIKPHSIKLIELRIYQSNKVLVDNPNPDDIQDIMDKIVHLNKILLTNAEGRY